MRPAPVSLAALAALAASALAEDRIRPTRLEVAANFHAASVYAYFDGDDDRDAAVRMEYRLGGRGEFRLGHPLSRTGKSKTCPDTGRFAGSVFDLRPDEPLEVRVTFEDPDGLAEGAPAVLTAAARTRSETFPAGSGRTYHVSPGGDDAAPGTVERPLRSVQRGVDLAEPGDVVSVGPGVYFGSVSLRGRSGRPDAYVTLRGAGVRLRQVSEDGLERCVEQRAVLTGAVAPAGPWQDAGGGAWAAEEKRRAGTATLGGTRIYHHGSMEDLRGAAAPLVPGWWQDEKAGRVYVRMADGRAPAAGSVRLGVVSCGLETQGAACWIVEGLVFDTFGGGPYSRGVEIAGGRDIVVRHCRFETMRTGVSLRRGAARCLVERSTFLDSGIWTWPWKAVKSHDTEGSAVSLAGAGGNVVRHNRIHGLFNGICPATWGDLENEAVNRDLDIHDNVFTEIGDDPLEPEGACMNVRFWHNRTFDTLQGISLAPITVGPAYVVRDRYVRFKQGALKLGVETRGVVFVYHVLGWRDTPGAATSVCGPWDNVHLRNCILRAPRYAVEDTQAHPVGCSFDYCCLHAAEAGPLVKWSGERYRDVGDLPAEAGFGRHNVRAEPYAGTDAEGRPTGLAPALIDAGVRIPGVNDDFRGRAPDIGPDEVR